MTTSAFEMRAFLLKRRAEREAAVAQRSARLEAALPGLTDRLVALGARRVWLFGSLAWGVPHERSDIDLAVEGLPKDQFWEAYGAVLDEAPSDFNLVEVEHIDAGFAARIRDHGRLLHDG